MEKKNLLFSCAATLLLAHCWVTCLTLSDESALLSIKSHFTFDSHSILATNWTNSTSYCHWFGVTCNTTPQLMQRVVALDLSNMSLQGTIAPQVGNLSQLEELYLGSNHLTGEIPKEISNLGHLRILSFPYNSLTGSVPPTIFNISSLQIIRLSYNSLSGALPMDICKSLPKLEQLLLPYNQLGGQIPTNLHKCTQLKLIGLAANTFTGSIPRGIGNLPNLEVLALRSNKLTGGIPKELGNLPNLEVLGLGSNKLTGGIPKELANLPNLERLYLQSNNITGPIPMEIGNLSQLKELSFGSNHLTGVTPEAIFNISTLQIISLPVNRLSGNLPTSIGLSLPNLEKLYLGGNEFSGKIPTSISNLSKLTNLDLGHNFFIGYVPTNLGNLRLLRILNFENNQLTNHPTEPELGFLTSLTNCKYLTSLWIGRNPLNGMLPNSVANLSNTLTNFYASSCQITGIIPRGIGNLTNIISLYLGGNDLTGSIPTTIGRMWKLQRLSIVGNRIHGAIPNDLCQLKNLGELYLSSNKLSGPIPSCLGNLTALQKLYLDSNSLTSKIPSSLWNLRDLLFLNLSSNFLSNSLPYEVSNMRNIIQLDMSKNQFSGNIPSTMGQLQSLAELNLSENKLQGPIPLIFGELISLEYLDLSCNNLSGTIPKSLEDLKYLKFLNVSLNKLQGAIPSGGPFENFTAESFMSNDALCGETRFWVRPCNTRTSKQSRMTKLLLKYILPCVAATTIIVVFVAFLLRRWNKKTDIPVTQTALPQPATHMRIPYHQLVEATNYFSEEFLVGKGGMSMVYKGVLSDGLVVAVKIFNLQLQGALKSFDAECEVMQNIRHRNLVKVITSCSTPDFKALVLEYMPNGSLEKQLYSHNYCLDVVQRLTIMTDVASALAYLHHENSTPVLHCDLKPNNVLLDEDMVAHVADFGIAKLFVENESLVQTKTLGTIGYMAPEYGSEGIVSTSGDVYSYGIMLMETFTRKKPTDEMFTGEVNLRSWVESLSNNTVMEIVDINMLRREDEHFAEKVKCISSIMTLALECTTESPEQRINMKDIVNRLKKIRIKLLAATRQ